MTMSGSTSNLTTQWTFRDGRDYVLSLTTTEMPNTLSFWISDKITGEEWTGCYDENGIEIITKRTGCYKSFRTFLSMIKSALLKKCESVILELLNIDDLNALSLHRQQQQNGGGRSLSADISPLNFQLYNSEVNCNCPPTSQSNPKSNKKSSPTITIDENNSINGTGSPTTIHSRTSLSVSPLNKRKYLIVTYIAEFDRVHYPLPLNYTNPPDLNVMQKNILNLRAEVSSLQAAKKDLAEKLDCIKTGALMPEEHSLEKGKACETSRRKLFSPNRKGAHVTFQPTMGEKLTQDNDDNSSSSNLSVTPSNDDVAEINDNTLSSTMATANAAVPCRRCSGTISALQAKIRDLENAIDFQKNDHLQAVEKLENEKHFLQHKVEAAEKYEMELWNQIQKLKEKVSEVDLDKEKQIKSYEICKDSRKSLSSHHQSRHDVFYSSFRKAVASPKTPFPPTNSRTSLGKRSSSQNSQNGSRSSSAGGSRCSIGTAIAVSGSSNPLQCRNRDMLRHQRSRGSVSPYHPRNYPNPTGSNRPSRSSSRQRFDPTAYVAEKKQKQNEIASLRSAKYVTLPQVPQGSFKVPARSEDKMKSIMKKPRDDEQYDKYDITLLRTKLSALQAFLETCVPQKQLNKH